MSKWYDITAVISITIRSVSADSLEQAEQIAQEIVEALADQMGFITTTTITGVKEQEWHDSTDG